jgi:predicted phosphodiesterase
MKTLIVGDIHGEWRHLNQLISKKKPDYILQVGDFGWWPHFHNKAGLKPKNKRFNQFGIKNHNTKIFWIPGNHENWDDLNCISQDEPTEIQDGITYCPFGTVLEINDQKILCCGGAESTDAKFRIEGIDWWRSEIITQKEMDNLPETNIDIVISHTIPRSFFKKSKWDVLYNRHNDPSTFALDLILEKYKPTKWFSGHFHHYHKQKIDDCYWTSLSMPGAGDTWWVELK